MPDISDAELIARCRRQDEDAWRRLIDRYASYVYTIITRAYGLNGEDAADAFQESVLRVFEGLPGYRGEGEFRAWLRQVVRNVCAARLRQPRRAEPLDAEVADQKLGEVLERIEQADTLLRALQSLDEPCRRIITLFYFQDQPYRSIAASLAIPEGTVASRLARCLVKLRAEARKRRGE